NDLASDDRQEIVQFAIVLLSLFGLFLAFSILHLMLFLYYRSVRSNLWFALFSLFMAALFLLSDLNINRARWLDRDAFGLSLLVLILLACYSLSGVVNSLFFSKRNVWIRALLLIC